MSTQSREPDVITRRGKPVSVILPIKEYQALLERLEDAKDVAYLKKARTKHQSFRPLEDYLAAVDKFKALEDAVFYHKTDYIKERDALFEGETVNSLFQQASASPNEVKASGAQ